MKVLQLIDSLEAGGAERIAVTYANTLAKHIDSYLCVTRAEGVLLETINEDVNYFFLNKKNTFDFKAICSLSKHINKNKITIIHAHSSSYFLACLVKLLNWNLKIVWHNHYGDSVNLPTMNLTVLQVFSYLFNCIIAVNATLKEWGIDKLNCKNVAYVPNFVTFEKDNNLKKTYLKGTKGKRITCIANLREEKDHINLLKAFSLLLKHHSDWTLHLIGKDFKDSYSKSIFNFVSTSQLDNNVFIYGSCKDVNHILSQTDMAVLSSKFEGLPVVLLEYGKAELPVVITNVGECSNVISNKENGLLVPSEDTQALYEGLNELIVNQKLSAKLAKQFKKHISENYAASIVIQQVLRLYNKIL